MTRFVLVHGAFMGAWCWAPLASILCAAGHQAEAPDLPGAGEDRARINDATLEAYVDHLVAVLRTGPPAVLVGHSLGGVTVTAAAARVPELIAGIVYLAAFVPRDGQSAADLARLPEGAGEGLRSRMVVAGDPPVATLSATDAVTVLFNRCTPQSASWASDRLGPHATWIPNIPVVAADRLDVPRTYIVCSDDNAIPPKLQRRIARDAGCWPVLELDADHSPFLSEPNALAGLLTRPAPRTPSTATDVHATTL